MACSFYVIIIKNNSINQILGGVKGIWKELEIAKKGQKGGFGGFLGV